MEDYEVVKERMLRETEQAIFDAIKRYENYVDERVERINVHHFSDRDIVLKVDLLHRPSRIDWDSIDRRSGIEPVAGYR